MKKVILSVFTIILAVYFIGCKSQSNNKTYLDSFNESKNDYSIFSDELNIYAEQDSVSVIYPKFDSSVFNCTGLNSLLETTLKEYLTETLGNDPMLLTLEVNYKLMLLNNSFASVLFYGTCNVQTAAHPTDFIFTVNILIEELQIIVFSDVIEINDNFIHEFISCCKSQNSSAIDEYIDSFSIDELSNEFKNKNINFCFSKDDIIVAINVPHAIGDVIEVVIPINNILQNIKAYI